VRPEPGDLGINFEVGSQVQARASRASDVGSIPIARSVKPTASIGFMAKGGFNGTSSCLVEKAKLNSSP
jgi:hypothetical protein